MARLPSRRRRVGNSHFFASDSDEGPECLLKRYACVRNDTEAWRRGALLGAVGQHAWRENRSSYIGACCCGELWRCAWGPASFAEGSCPAGELLQHGGIGRMICLCCMTLRPLPGCLTTLRRILHTIAATSAWHIWPASMLRMCCLVATAWRCAQIPRRGRNCAGICVVLLREACRRAQAVAFGRAHL